MEYYSQHAEDRWIVEHLRLPDIGVMVEVGVGRWKENSNSLHFEQRGWQTILVEPNPALWPEIEANRKGKLFKCAAGDRDGTVQFVCDGEPTVSGILRTNGVKIDVPIRTLYSILLEVGIGHVDILSIDTEGTEIDVWRGLTLFRPVVVIIEYSTIGLPERPIPIIQRFLNDGYHCVHTTAGNLIFLRQ